MKPKIAPIKTNFNYAGFPMKALMSKYFSKLTNPFNNEVLSHFCTFHRHLTKYGRALQVTLNVVLRET